MTGVSATAWLQVACFGYLLPLVWSGTIGRMTTSAAKADAFYGETLDESAVWSVSDAQGHPAPQNADGQRSMPFWSKCSRAEHIVAAVEAYRGFDVVRIPLDEWRSRWLPGLQADGLRVGLNWSGARATGYDLEPDAVERNVIARGAHA
jgi:uncharacterized protein DUF2750